MSKTETMAGVLTCSGGPSTRTSGGCFTSSTPTSTSLTASCPRAPRRDLSSSGRWGPGRRWGRSGPSETKSPFLSLSLSLTLSLSPLSSLSHSLSLSLTLFSLSSLSPLSLPSLSFSYSHPLHSLSLFSPSPIFLSLVPSLYLFSFSLSLSLSFSLLNLHFRSLVKFFFSSDIEKNEILDLAALTNQVRRHLLFMFNII